jgi:hypothetical protein
VDEASKIGSEVVVMPNYRARKIGSEPGSDTMKIRLDNMELDRLDTSKVSARSTYISQGACHARQGNYN